VLEVGGRFVCGNAQSQMPVWSDENGGPLNYRQIEEIIAFIRAPNQEYEVRDPELNEPTGEHFTGWVDPNYAPEPDATPYPDCWVDAVGGGEGASPGPSLPADATTIEVTASGTAFVEKELTAPAGEAFAIHMVNEDAPTPHDVDIRDASGAVVADNPFGPEGELTYSIPALEAGEYEFFCSVHPIPAMTGTLTVE
jgi:plastocyanin